MKAAERVERTAIAVTEHPKVRAAWTKARPVLKFSLYGAAFVGGGLLLARWFGPRTAQQLGRAGGEGFAQGVNQVQAALGRGARWG